MPSSIEVLSLIRESYLEVFRSALVQERRKHSDEPSGAEVLMRYGAEVGLLCNLARIDFATKNNFIEVNTENTTNIQSDIRFEFGLEAEISAAVWNGVEIESVFFDATNEQIVDWFEKWIDLADLKVEDNFGLHGVIHQVHIEPIDDRTNLSIDFGSAPVEAAIEFFQVLFAMGNNKISIGSSWNEEQIAT